MESWILLGKAHHRRIAPVEHCFVAPLFLLALKLNDIDVISRKVMGFGYNRFALASVWDKDYLPGDGVLFGRVRELLEKKGIPGVAQVLLITVPRVLGYTFNPVNFYLCNDANDKRLAFIAEVNNTFGESHVYVALEEERGVVKGGQSQYVLEKTLFVSPFFERKGRYELTIVESQSALTIEVNLAIEGKVVFQSALSGTKIPLTSRNLARTLLTYPLSAWAPLSRICYQAYQLYFYKHLIPFMKPEPSSGNFVKGGSLGTWVWIRQKIVEFFVKGIQRRRVLKSNHLEG